MKKTHVSVKKLSLKKNTITHLNERQMQYYLGGGKYDSFPGGGCETSCIGNSKEFSYRPKPIKPKR